MIDRITAALSRRNLLIGLAASATAATVAEAADAPQESQELLAMADALPAVLAEYVAARDNVRAIVAEWSPQWPVPGEQIIRYGEGCKDYRALDGRGIDLPLGNSGIRMMPQIGTPDYFDAAAKRHEEVVARIEAKGGRGSRNLTFHRKWSERERAAIEPARAFWAEVDRITMASGFEAAKARLARAEAALKSAVDQIMLTDDKTITGTVIKAQAMTTWAEADRLSRLFNDRGPAWADLLAASIVKHAA